MAVLNSDGELVLYGFVGDNWWDEGFTSREVLDALADLGRETDITVRINSGGGYAMEGLAIFNALSVHKGHVTVEVDAIAASAASVIAMAGDTITMRTGSLMMIHDPSGVTIGTAADHEKNLQALNKMGDQMAGIYADQSGDAPGSIRAEMKDELWLTADEAVDRGFATESDSAKAEAFTAFDYRLYSNAPRELAAMAKTNRWSFEAGKSRAAPASQTARQTKERSEMPKPKDQAQPGNDGVTEAISAPEATPTASDERGRIRAILSSEEGKATPKLAEHLAYETEMSAEAAVAMMQAAAADAPPAEPGDPPADPPADPTAYQQQRASAAALAKPGGGSAPTETRAKIDTAGIYASRRAKKEA